MHWGCERETERWEERGSGSEKERDKERYCDGILQQSIIIIA